jgi:hypothetical protein
MSRWSFAFAALGAALLVPAVARADDEDEAIEPLPAAAAAPAPILTTTAVSPAGPSVDTVHLRSGGMYRGRVTEIVPGDHVTIIVTTDGTARRLPWSDLERVIVASTPIPPATATATAPTGGTATPSPMVGPRARVHITTKRQVILYRRPAGSSAWEQACTSPCNLELPLGDTYRIAGSGLSQNKELRLQASPGGAVDILVDPPSVGGMVLGGLTAGVGYMVGYIGLLVMAGGASTGDDETANGGALALLLGAGAGVVGTVVFINSATTDIIQRGPGADQDAFVRRPTWKSAGGASSGMPTASFPVLFSGTF